MSVLQSFYKTPGAVWDFRIEIAAGEAALSDATAAIVDRNGNAVAAGATGAPTVGEPTIEGAIIVVRVSGGARGTEWYLKINANLSDGRKAEKYAPLSIQYPLSPAADPIVVEMGGGGGVSPSQLNSAVAAEARAREAADDALRVDVNANTARRLGDITLAGRTITFAFQGGAETLTLPNFVRAVALNGSTLTITHLDDSTEDITLPTGGVGGQTAQQVQDAIRTAIAALTIPPPMANWRTLFALVVGDDAPVIPVITKNLLLPAGQGFVGDDVVVAPWTQLLPASVPAGQTLWQVGVLIFGDNSVIVGGLVRTSPTTADRTALDSIAALRRDLNANRSAAIWAQDLGGGERTISDAAIPSSIARDSELSELLNGASWQDGLFSLTRHDGNNPVQLRILPAGGAVGDVLKRTANGLAWQADNTGGGGSGAADSLVSITARGIGATAELVWEARGGVSMAIGYPAVPIPQGQDDNAKVLTADGSGAYSWQAVAAAGQTAEQVDAAIRAALVTRDSEITNLSAIVFGNILPEALRVFGEDITLTPHPAGVWNATPSATVKMNIGGAFLFDNARTDTRTVPQEIAAVSGYSVADLTGMNFVREHSDPNEDSNPFRGVTPYCTGAVPITTPASLKRKVISCVFGAMTRARPTSRALDAETTFLEFGGVGLIRWSDQGLDVRIGRSAAYNRAVTHFEGVGSVNLSSLVGIYRLNLAEKFTGLSRRIKLTANVFVADESVARSSPSVEVIARQVNYGFSIPIEGRVPLIGVIAYNPATRQIIIAFTGGSKEFNSHIQLDVGVQITDTINLPAREEFTGILGATSLTAGVAAVFEENHKNVAVFALEKQYDEPDGDDNLMTLFWRINRLTGRVNLRQTRAELKLDSTDIKLGAPTTYISHIQVGSAGEDLGTADLLALNPEIKGWGQLRREHRDNDWSLAARFHAHAFFIANADGTTTPLLPPAAWAREGDGTKIPADKIPVSVSAPSGIILPRVINVPHFTAQTADIDLGFKLDGANGVRSQYDRLVVPYEYKKGRDQRELGGASHRFTRDFKSIPLDALPGESTLQATDARWDRYVELDFYPDTLQRVALHIWQENQRVAPVAGQPPVDPISNLHINLVYWNDSDGRNYLAPLPGRITHFSALSIAEFHDSGRRQVYLMPRSAKGEPGDTGATGAKGDKGDDGAQGIRGEQGEPGADGAPGATGAKGDKGDDGAQGIRGEQGEPGADGAPGAAGAKGDKGDQGDQGEQGERGLPGADGAAGATGAKGDKGDQGEQGERGLPGADGAAGATGAKGDKGDQGEQGERGLPGADSAVQAVHTLTTANGGIITQTIPTRSRLVLPANYANFKSLEVVVLDNNGQITTRDILVSWLVATASNNRIRVSGAGFMTWTRSSRNMSITEGDEFLAAVLTARRKCKTSPTPQHGRRRRRRLPSPTQRITTLS